VLRYRNDYDTPRSIPDADVELVEPGAEFESPVELHNPFLTPLEPAGQVFNVDTLRWEKPGKQKKADSQASVSG